MIIRFVGFYGLLWFQLVSGVRIRWITTKLDSSASRACMVLVKHKHLKQLIIHGYYHGWLYLTGDR